ncbi:MAG: transcriptional regulator, LuxR family, partial [Solirubrobacterales bacterium]|nr:transcriptional regulator, LuxR family [Solirubrobacterales bacterium]
MDATATGKGTAALIERDEELDAIGRVLAAAVDGAGATVLVEGAAGMGKSALLSEAVELASGGLRVLAARADVLERDFPFGIARQLFEPALRAASPAERERLLEGAAGLAGEVLLGGAAPGREASQLVAHALYWLAWGLADERPLLITVDDAQWADRASARALLHLARRVEDMPIALVIALRPGEAGAPPELTELLAAEPATVTLAVGPLSETGSAGVVRRFDGAAGEELCARCHAAAGGNPLVVRELARIASEAGPEAIADDGSVLGGAHSRVLDRAVRRRLAGLAPG